MSSNLIVHRGARFVERAELDSASALTPPPTATWFPIAHNVVLDRVSQTLSDAGYTIRAVKTALSRNDMRLFSTIDLDCSLYGGETSLSIAVVNSVDRSLPMKMIAGTRVFICDNLALRSDLMAAVSRKHSRFGLARFNEALARAVASLGAFKDAEAERIKRYLHTEVSPLEADALLLRSFERGLVSHRLLPRVIAELRKPSFDYGCEANTLWVVEQAFTTVLATLLQSNPQRFCAASLAVQGLLAEATGLNPVP